MADILIVDDEEEICDFLSGILQAKGLKVTFALSGEDALRLVGEKPWKLSVVDLKLSTSVTGLDVIKAVRERWPAAPVIAMTGYIDEPIRRETEKLGVLHYIEKPDGIQPDLFLKKIQDVLSLAGQALAFFSFLRL